MNSGRTENMHLDKVSCDASRPPDYPNYGNSNQQGTGLNPGILVTV